MVHGLIDTVACLSGLLRVRIRVWGSGFGIRGTEHGADANTLCYLPSIQDVTFFCGFDRTCLTTGLGPWKSPCSCYHNVSEDLCSSNSQLSMRSTIRADMMQGRGFYLRHFQHFNQYVRVCFPLEEHLIELTGESFGYKSPTVMRSTFYHYVWITSANSPISIQRSVAVVIQPSSDYTQLANRRPTKYIARDEFLLILFECMDGLTPSHFSSCSL